MDPVSFIILAPDQNCLKQFTWVVSGLWKLNALSNFAKIDSFNWRALTFTSKLLPNSPLKA